MSAIWIQNFIFLILTRRYFFIAFRERVREREHWCERKALISCRDRESNRTPGMCPGWGIEPTTFWLQDITPTNWATPAMATLFFKDFLFLFYYGCPSFSPFDLLLPSYPHPHSQFPHSCPCPWVSDTRSLSSPSSLHCGHCQCVSCFHACGSILFTRFLL